MIMIRPTKAERVLAPPLFATSAVSTLPVGALLPDKQMTRDVLADEVDHLSDNLQAVFETSGGIVPFPAAHLAKLARGDIRAKIDRRCRVATITATLDGKKLRAVLFVHHHPSKTRKRFAFDFVPHIMNDDKFRNQIRQ